MRLTSPLTTSIYSILASADDGRDDRRSCRGEDNHGEGLFFGLMPTATLLGLLSATLFAPLARGDEPRLSISGYDPVAYFTDGKPLQGKAEFEYLWHRLRWRFANNDHRDLFMKSPDRYAPQYDGYCAMGTSNDAAAHKDTVDPEAWAIVDGKLYLTHNQYWLKVWRGKADEKNRRAYATGQGGSVTAGPF